jgi:hypothetical protein
MVTSWVLYPIAENVLRIFNNLGHRSGVAYAALMPVYRGPKIYRIFRLCQSDR